MLGGEVLSQEEFEKSFLRDKLHIPEDAILSLTNSFEGNAENKNCNLFFSNESNEFVSVLNWDAPLPVRLNTAELSWLYYALNDKRSLLFLNEGLRNSLLLEIDKSKIIDISKYIISKNQQYCFDSKIISFMNDVIIHSINTHQSIYLDKNEEFIVYKILFDQTTNAFSLILYPVKTNGEYVLKDDLKITHIEDYSSISIGNPVDMKIGYYKYHECIDMAYKCITMHAETPITLQLVSHSNDKKTMADDRCSYLFSSYDTTSYIDKDNNLNMTINYYDFQKNEVIDNILSLGKYVKVTSPSDMCSIIKSLIQ